MVRPIIKSLILGIATVFINFGTHYSFESLFFNRANVNISLVFTTYVSIIEFIIIFFISWILFKMK